MQTFLQVQSLQDAKGTSSWLKAFMGKAIKFVIGIDAFKKSTKDSPDFRAALALLTGRSPEAVDAALRYNGQSPESYYDAVEKNLGNNIEGMDSNQINAALAQSDKDSADPNQRMWLAAGVGLFLLVALGGNKGGRRRRSRPKAHYRPRPRPRYRKRRRR